MKRAFIVVLTLLVVAGCDRMRTAPQVIAADGEEYIACRSMVWISEDGGGLLGGGAPVYRVSFTDAMGLEHLITGIKKLAVSDLPPMVPVPMPTDPPDPDVGLDNTGQPYKNGLTYPWADGRQAMLSGGKWKAVMTPNRACSQQ